MHLLVKRACCAALVLTGLLHGATAADPQSYDDLDHPMAKDPELFIPGPEIRFDERLPKFWTDALSAPEADVRRRSAETIGLAKRMGMEGLEIAVPELQKLANQENEDPLVRVAAVRALVAIDDPAAADAVMHAVEQLDSAAESGAVDALARWQHAPARTMWQRRLDDTSTGRRDLLLAIQGLAAMQDQQAAANLKKWIGDPYQSFDVRLASARALATLEPSGLEELASERLADQSAHRRERLLAAALLRQHSGPAAEDLLEKLALDTEPAVANVALQRLIEMAPDRIARNQAQLLASRDATVRRWTIQALAQFPTSEHAIVLAGVTKDPHPELRVQARDTLLAFASEHNLQEVVLEEATQLLAQKDWRGIEQACRIFGTLDHKPAAPEVVEQLTNPRSEVHTTAAWCLRRLAVPETLPDVHAFASMMTDRMLVDRKSDYDQMFTHLFELFAIMDYKAADPMLRKYIPKLVMSADSRAAAVWALGHLHKDNPPAELIQALEERLLDAGTVPPESENVRQNCAVSLGRMKAESTLPSLQRFWDEMGPYTGPSYACGWAIEQITGKPVEKPEPSVEYMQDWFMTPLK